MELIIFIGIQASGKSTFYRQRLVDSHIRLNLDMLRTRHREKILFEACIKGKQPVVIDNTNPTREDRARYIVPAKVAGFSVEGYYFQSSINGCKRRNERRLSNRPVPLPAILGTHKKLELPSLAEGFDRLYDVRIGPEDSFIVEEWTDELQD